jgi:hypothetical protein
LGSTATKAAIIGSAVFIGIGILFLAGFIVPLSIGIIFTSSMIITLSVPPFAAGILELKSNTKYKNWVKIGTIDFKTMLSMNASIITGSLIFITISSLGRNFVLSGLFTPEYFLVSTTSLVTALAALIIIPFSASSILFLLNGPSISALADHRHQISGSPTTEGAIYSAKGSRSGTPTETKEVPAEPDQGVKVAIIYMMAGFLWIITSMTLLLYFAAIAPTSDQPRFVDDPLQDQTFEAGLGGVAINYAIPEAIDAEEIGRAHV